MHDHEYVVVNLDDSNSQGTHWVCASNRAGDKDVLYYDSFAVPPCNEIVKYLKTSGKGILYNSSQQQDIRSNNCGSFCLYVIKELAKGRAMYDVLYSLSQQPSVSNEETVKKR